MIPPGKLNLSSIWDVGVEVGQGVVYPLCCSIVLTAFQDNGRCSRLSTLSGRRRRFSPDAIYVSSLIFFGK